MELLTKVKAPDGIMSTQFEGEAVLMHISKGEYYGLNEVGAFIWTLMSNPVSIKTLCQAVEQEFDVLPELCKSDILTLIEQLGAIDLVEIVSKKV
jgi:Coenzyme PQQ synthesis protein D (PqqD)